MPSTRSTTELRAEACKHIMRLAGIESDSELVTILEQNGVLKAGLVFLVRADKPTLAKMTGKVKRRAGSDQKDMDRTLTVTPLHVSTPDLAPGSSTGQLPRLLSSRTIVLFMSFLCFYPIDSFNY